MSARPVPTGEQSCAGAHVRELFDAHARMVLGLCRLLLRDAGEAEDATQQTFLSAYRSLLNGTKPREPAHWLAAIARNECRARIRRRMIAPVTVRAEAVENELPAGPDAAEVAARREEAGELRDAVAGLPRRQRHAVVLRHYYGLSYQEIATALGVPITTVEGLLFRARRGLIQVARPLAVPIGLRDELARLVPGFAEAAPVAAAGGLGMAALAAKLASAPLGAKVAAGVTAVAIGTTAAGDVRERPAARAGTAPSPVEISVEQPAPVVGEPEGDDGAEGRDSDEDEDRSGSSGSGDGDQDRSGSSGSGSSGSDSSGSGPSGSSGSDSSGSGSSGSGSSGSDSSGSGSSGSGSSDSSGPGSGDGDTGDSEET